MWKVLTAIVVVCVAGLGLSFASLVLPQKNYASQGVCTAGEIDRTYAELKTIGLFHRAAKARAGEEFLRIYIRAFPAHHQFEIGVRQVFEETFSRRQTAAYICNIPGSYFSYRTLPRKSVPALAEALRPYLADDDEAWRQVTCATMTESLAAHKITAQSVATFRDHPGNACRHSG